MARYKGGCDENVVRFGKIVKCGLPKLPTKEGEGAETLCRQHRDALEAFLNRNRGNKQ